MATQTSDESYKGILIAAVIAFGIFMGYPMLTEGTGNSCLAYEKRAIGGLSSLDNGRAAAQSAHNQLPEVPTPFACTYLYWKSLAEK